MGSFSFQSMHSHRACLRALVLEWSRYKTVRGLRFRRTQLGREWHRSGSACAVYGMFHLQLAQFRRRCGQVLLPQCMQSAVWVDFNNVQAFRRVSSSVCSQCTIGCPCGQFRVPCVQTTRHECEWRAVAVSVRTIPGADENRLRFQPKHFAVQMCVRSRSKCGKIRFWHTAPLLTDSTHAFGRINGSLQFCGLTS